MKILKLLFGSPDTAMETVGTITKGLDALHYSKEEQAEHKAKAMEWLNKYMESTQGQNLARRFIAIIVTLEWALILNIGVFCGLMAAPVAKDQAPDKWQAKADFVFKVLDECVNEAFMGILMFYFMVRIGMEAINAYKGKGKPAE